MDKLNRQVKPTQGQYTKSRIRFHGDIQTIKEIEDIIMDKAVAHVTRNNAYQQLFGVRSSVLQKEISILSREHLYSYHVRLRYDSRDNTAELTIRDKDIWHLCRLDNRIISLLGDTRHEEV